MKKLKSSGAAASAVAATLGEATRLRERASHLRKLARNATSAECHVLLEVAEKLESDAAQLVWNIPALPPATKTPPGERG